MTRLNVTMLTGRNPMYTRPKPPSNPNGRGFNFSEKKREFNSESLKKMKESHPIGKTGLLQRN